MSHKSLLTTTISRRIYPRPSRARQLHRERLPSEGLKEHPSEPDEPTN